jgi:hypothetical protein
MLTRLILSALLTAPLIAQEVHPKPYCEPQIYRPTSIYELEHQRMQAMPQEVCRDYTFDACFDVNENDSDLKGDTKPLIG